MFLDSESIFVMPSAFNDDVQFGLQVSRPTNLYALKALQLREKVFQWIARRTKRFAFLHWLVCSFVFPLFFGLFFSVFLRAKASQKQRFEAADDAPSSSVFASLSQWYDHARTVWQTLSMCGTDLLQFRTMRPGLKVVSKLRETPESEL